MDAAEEMSVAMLPRPLMAAGGRAKLPSSWAVFTLLLPVMSVEGAGVGGKLGRGMMVRGLAFALIGLAGARRLAVQSTAWRGGGGDTAEAGKTSRRPLWCRVRSPATCEPLPCQDSSGQSAGALRARARQ